MRIEPHLDDQGRPARRLLPVADVRARGAVHGPARGHLPLQPHVVHLLLHPHQDKHHHGQRYPRAGEQRDRHRLWHRVCAACRVRRVDVVQYLRLIPPPDVPAALGQVLFRAGQVPREQMRPLRRLPGREGASRSLVAPRLCPSAAPRLPLGLPSVASTLSFGGAGMARGWEAARAANSAAVSLDFCSRAPTISLPRVDR
eukprot:3404424-Prymnesium_polylepis.1